MKSTTPSMSRRRQSCSMFWEWFIRVWYVADRDRHAAAVSMKMEKATKLPAPECEYRLAR